MNKYILSIDPSLKDSGFVLWKDNKPIWIGTYNFSKYQELEFNYQIMNNVFGFCKTDFLEIVMERGIYHPKTGKSKEILDVLRGTIIGLFSEWIHPKRFVSPSQWKANHKKERIQKLLFEPELNTKELSIQIAQDLIDKNEWEIDIKNNNNISDAILIGWYWINKDGIN